MAFTYALRNPNVQNSPIVAPGMHSHPSTPPSSGIVDSPSSTPVTWTGAAPFDAFASSGAGKTMLSI